MKAQWTIAQPDLKNHTSPWMTYCYQVTPDINMSSLCQYSQHPVQDRCFSAWLQNNLLIIAVIFNYSAEAISFLGADCHLDYIFCECRKQLEGHIEQLKVKVRKVMLGYKNLALTPASWFCLSIDISLVYP